LGAEVRIAYRARSTTKEANKYVVVEGATRSVGIEVEPGSYQVWVKYLTEDGWISYFRIGHRDQVFVSRWPGLGTLLKEVTGDLKDHRSPSLL